MPPSLVEPPKILRPGREGKRGSKYVNPEQVETAAKLAAEGWCGDLIEPVDTIVKARIAASRWKEALCAFTGKPKDAYAIRVWTIEPGKFVFAIALKQGA